MLEIIIKTIIFLALGFVAFLYYRKTKDAKNSSVRILLGVLLLAMLLSYLIPGTQISSYGITNDNVIPMGFADTFSSGLIALNISLQAIVYIVVIGVFYAVLKGTGAYEDLVENTATAFKKNKSLFVVLTILGLGLSSLFTGEIYAMIMFVPFLISVIKKLGYSKEIAVSSTVGAILLGRIGTFYSAYSDQFLSLTVKDNIMIKVLLTVIALVCLIAFILIFGRRPEKTELNGKVNTNKKVKQIVAITGFSVTVLSFVTLWLVNSLSLGLIVGGLVLVAALLTMIVFEHLTDKKTMAINIILFLTFVILLIGFVPWEQYFGYTGFTEFLTDMRTFKLLDVSVFDAFVGSQNSIAAFGTWQLYNASILIVAVSMIIFLLCTLVFKTGVKFSSLTDSVGKGIKKSVPYVVILGIAATLLVVAYQSGVLTTISIELTKKSVDIFKGTLVSVLSALFYPDVMYSTQFTIYSVMAGGSVSGVESLLGMTFQVVYSAFLLISPTSILLLFGLKIAGVSYKDWIKYIYRFFIILIFALLIAVKVNFEGLDLEGIIIIVLVLAALILFLYQRLMKKDLRKGYVKNIKEDVDDEEEEVKTETKKVEVKKTTTKKTTTKKPAKKAAPKKTTTKKTTKK